MPGRLDGRGRRRAAATQLLTAAASCLAAACSSTSTWAPVDAGGSTVVVTPANLVVGLIGAMASEGTFSLVAAGAHGMVNAALLHVASADWHTSRYAHAGKRGGELWYGVDTASPPRARRMPRGAAALQSAANGALGGVAGALPIISVSWAVAIHTSAVSAGLAAGEAAARQLGGGTFGKCVTTSVLVATACAATIGCYRAIRALQAATPGLWQEAARHAARGSYDLAEWWEARTLRLTPRVRHQRDGATLVADAV